MDEKEAKDFYAFRGFIEFSKQLNLFNTQIEESSKKKNEIFRSVFKELEDEKKLTSSTFKKRKYLLLFIGREDNVVHCKLARKKEYKKDDLVDYKLITTEEHAYPNIDVFIDLNAQKFLIESKTDVFENYNTCIDVIKSIMDNSFVYSGSYIEIEPIVNESFFWNAFNSNIPVYAIEFKLNSPNLFDGDTDAEVFMRSARINANADKMTLKFENNKDGLEPNKEGINSYVKYTSDGGGSWKQKIKGENGRRKIISSMQVNKKIEIEIDEEITDEGRISRKTLENVITKFSHIETIERFK